MLQVSEGVHIFSGIPGIVKLWFRWWWFFWFDDL